MTKKKYKITICILSIIWLITAYTLLFKINIFSEIQEDYFAYKQLSELKIDKITIEKSNNKNLNKEIKLTFNSKNDQDKFDELTKKIMHPDKKPYSYLKILCLVINVASIFILILLLTTLTNNKWYENLP